MEFIPIFVSDNLVDGIWSIHFDNEFRNELGKFFNQVNDIEWLNEFFQRNKPDLIAGFFGNITVDGAVSRTLIEAEELENMLYDYAEQGFDSKDINLQHLFKPLNNFEYNITIHQKSKIRIRGGWLRLYAIRIAENCYLLSGGAIKLTYDMKRMHLQKELFKLEQVKEFLRRNNINYPEDLYPYDYE